MISFVSILSAWPSASNCLHNFHSSGYSSRRRGTWDGKSIIHPRKLWVRGSNLTGGHNRLSCPRSADTALKPYLTLPNLHNFPHIFLAGLFLGSQTWCHCIQ